MTYSVQQADIDAYNADGVVPLRDVISPQQLERLAAAIEDDIREPGPFFHGYQSDEGGLPLAYAPEEKLPA